MERQTEERLGGPGQIEAKWLTQQNWEPIVMDRDLRSQTYIHICEKSLRPHGRPFHEPYQIYFLLRASMAELKAT